YQERQPLKDSEEFWKRAADLKHSLLNLPGQEAFEGSKQEEHQEEADVLAREAIKAFGDLQKKYEMIRPAILHNLFLNIGLKKEGLCWEWARDLTDHLRTLDLKTFDLLWATAREGTLREHNVIVIVSHGRSLEDGLLLDGWRHSGKPYWGLVTEDDHPWKLGR